MEPTSHDGRPTLYFTPTVSIGASVVPQTWGNAAFPAWPCGLADHPDIRPSTGRPLSTVPVQGEQDQGTSAEPGKRCTLCCTRAFPPRSAPSDGLLVPPHMPPGPPRRCARLPRGDHQSQMLTTVPTAEEAGPTAGHSATGAHQDLPTGLSQYAIERQRSHAG